MTTDYTPQQIDEWRLQQDYRRLEADRFCVAWSTCFVPTPPKRSGYEVIRGGYKRKAMLPKT